LSHTSTYIRWIPTSFIDIRNYFKFLFVVFSFALRIPKEQSITMEA